ncbi:hypothetical protein EON66_07135 [archaeon]|nr:MAG: hypothetical protein EON66_07135 [archaeon]
MPGAKERSAPTHREALLTLSLTAALQCAFPTTCVLDIMQPPSALLACTETLFVHAAALAAARNGGSASGSGSANAATESLVFGGAHTTSASSRSALAAAVDAGAARFLATAPRVLTQSAACGAFVGAWFAAFPSTLCTLVDRALATSVDARAVTTHLCSVRDLLRWTALGAVWRQQAPRAALMRLQTNLPSLPVDTLLRASVAEEVRALLLV